MSNKDNKDGWIGLGILFFIFMPIIGWLCNDTGQAISIWQLYLGELSLIGIGVAIFFGLAKLL